MDEGRGGSRSNQQRELDKEQSLLNLDEAFGDRAQRGLDDQQADERQRDLDRRQRELDETASSEDRVAEEAAARTGRDEARQMRSDES